MNKIDKVALIFFRDGKILSTRSKGKEKYYLPGGKRESGESDLQTLSREIKEELAVDIIEPTASLYGIFEAQADEKQEGISVKMTCYIAEFVGDLKADSEVEEIVWLTYADVEKTSCVDKLIFMELHKQGMLS